MAKLHTFHEFRKLYPTLETIDYLDYIDTVKLGKVYDIDLVIEKRKLEKMNNLFNK